MASSSWEKRNAAARAKGYRSYYDYRKHGYGERPPGEPVDRPVAAQRSGALGPAALRRAVKDPELALLVEVPGQRYRRGARKGELKTMRYIATFRDGRIHEYQVPVPKAFGDDEQYEDYEDWLDAWHDEFDDYDIDFMAYDTGATANAATG